MITKKYKNFNEGITPNLYGDGFVRVEHFNTVTGQARPFRNLTASTHTDYTNLSKFINKGSELFALAKSSGSTRPNVLKWNSSTYVWEIYQSINSDGTYAEVLHRYEDYFWGLWKGTHIWRIEFGDVNGSFQALSYTTYADPITHSKDALMYIPTDNKLSRFNGTTITSTFSFPDKYVITSICEDGDYISVVGYDSEQNKGIYYKWDRDSSLETLTAKQILGDEVPYHVANINGNVFIISLRGGPLANNTPSVEDSYIVVRYFNGSKFDILKQFRMQTPTSIGGKYLSNEKLYVNVTGKLLGESASHYFTLSLDQDGKVEFAQNIGINDAGSASSLPGIYREGDGFWIGGRTDGAWHTSTAYSTTSILETTKIRSDDMTKSIDFVGAVVEFEPLPSGASVVISSRANDDTTWTTLGTFSTQNTLKGSIVKQGCATTPTVAKERDFRIETTGGAVITGLQIDLEEVNDSVYG